MENENTTNVVSDNNLTQNKVKQTIKEVFMEEIDSSAKTLIRRIISPASLGIAIIMWALISAVSSIYRRVDTFKTTDGVIHSRCEMTIPLDTYFAGKLLCPVK